MRRLSVILLIVLVLSSVSVLAQYNKATKYQYTSPRVVQYPSLTCAAASVSQGPMCYREGTKQCRALNAGRCYDECVRNVRSTCFSRERLPLCVIPPGFEKDFTSRADCVRGARDYCVRGCGNAMAERDCQQRAYTRCSYIGRLFV